MGTIDDLRKAVETLDVEATRIALGREPNLLRDNPDFSAQLLSLAIRMIDFQGSQTERGDAARATIESNRGVFDALLESGAAVNCGPGLEDLPPLHVAVQMTHPVLAEELLRRGADPNQVIVTLTPARINPDPDFHAVLKRFGAKDV